MRDPARQLADRLHFLGLMKFRLSSLPVGDVEGETAPFHRAVGKP